MNRYAITWSGPLAPSRFGNTNERPLPRVVNAESRVAAMVIVGEATRGKGRLPSSVMITYVGPAEVTYIPAKWIEKGREVLSTSRDHAFDGTAFIETVRTRIDREFVPGSVVEPAAGVVE